MGASPDGLISCECCGPGDLAPLCVVVNSIVAMAIIMSIAQANVFMFEM